MMCVTDLRRRGLRYLATMLLCLAPLEVVLGAELFVLTDPKGDDFGSGDTVYPNRDDMSRGSLDLQWLKASDGSGGTWFRVRMGSRIADPKGRNTYIGKESLDRLARHGFYTFNIDIYIDQDRVQGSGRTDTLPGRKVSVAANDAWEKAVILTPRPQVARAYYKLHLEKLGEDAKLAEVGRLTREDSKLTSAEIESQLTREFLFPTQIRIKGGREIEFFVPDSFLGARANPDWAYTVVVTGCEVEQLGKVVNLTPGEFNLMVIPVARGRHQDRFGLLNDADPNQAPVIDLLAPSVADQQRALSDYNISQGQFAVVPAISPAGTVAIAGTGTAPARPATAGTMPAQPSSPRGSSQTAGTATSPGPAFRREPQQGDGRRTIPDRLRTLNTLRDDGLVSDEEYQALRRKILTEL